MKERLYPNASLGQYGGIYQTGAGTITPTTAPVFCVIQVLQDAAVTTVGSLTLTAVTLTAGTTIYGRFTSVTIGGGSIIAYLGE